MGRGGWGLLDFWLLVPSTGRRLITSIIFCHGGGSASRRWVCYFRYPIMRVAERARAPAYLPAACRWQTLFRNQSRGVKRTPDRLKNLDRVYPPINVINANVRRLNKNQLALGKIENRRSMRFVRPCFFSSSIFLDCNLRGWRKYLVFQFVCRTNRKPRPYYEIETRGETLDRLRLSNDVITRIHVNYWNCLQIPLTDSAVRLNTCILFSRLMKARRKLMAEYRPFLESWKYLVRRRRRQIFLRRM